jgi:hypothetical protein
VLCKHEVVGSIPSVSTIVVISSGARIGATMTDAVRWIIRISKVCTDARPSPAHCEIDIVKRECGRRGSESWSSPVMFGKQL